MPDLVSVVIPAHNSANWIRDAIGSVLTQSYEPLEVIVVDDGSVDATAELAEQSLRDFRGPWRVLRQPNAGVSAARNHGWRVAQGAWIQLLDSDDLLAADKIRLQMAVAQTAPRETAVVYSGWQRVAERGGRLVPEEPMRTPDVDGKPAACHLITKNVMGTGSYLVRREWVERVRGFDERMRIYEDDDFISRVSLAGGAFRYVPCPEPVLLYRMFPEKPRWGDASARYKLRNVATAWLGVVVRTAKDGRIDTCGLSPEDRDDLVEDCTMFLRNLYVHDRAAFRELLASVRAFIPGYAPKRPRYLQLLSKTLGYERAEALVAVARSVKQRLPKR